MIKIKECGEPLVDIKKVCPKIIVRLGPYSRPSDSKAYARLTVAKKLCQAQKHLPKGITFVVRSAWRSPKQQKTIFENIVKKFKKQNPDWTEQQIIKEAKKYVAPFNGLEASGHICGAAIDVRLVRNNRLVPMRSKKLTYQENSKTKQSKLPNHIQKNRDFLIQALTKVGLVNYPMEFWHWSYGDRQWAKKNNKKTAIYGVVDKP
ncbi:M15 family metallopeptidase [Candidatus Woesearchaeota archaeon]|nr:M15 family metallopeptidase [Candidatus Woesearchaeota archaeon]